MLSRFLTDEPETLSRGEQIASAIVAATLATVAAAAVASVLFVTAIAFLR